MTKREQRVIKAFENCIMSGEYTSDYAITIIEDDKRYGWLSTTAKDSFYEWLDAYENPTTEESAESDDATTESAEESAE